MDICCKELDLRWAPYAGDRPPSGVPPNDPKVCCEVSAAEADKANKADEANKVMPPKNWQAGCYLLTMSPDEVHKRLKTVGIEPTPIPTTIG